MALFEIETAGHIVITWAEDEENAKEVLQENYPRRADPRYQASSRRLGHLERALDHRNADVSTPRGECLAKASGDKLHAIRLCMQETGARP